MPRRDDSKDAEWLISDCSAPAPRATEPFTFGLGDRGHVSLPSVWLDHGIDAASQALGHADLNATLAIYGHQDQTDLEAAMDTYASWLEQQREDGIVPPEADA